MRVRALLLLAAVAALAGCGSGGHTKQMPRTTTTRASTRPLTGIDLVLSRLETSARTLDARVQSGDAAGARRALASFTRLFGASEEPVGQASPDAAPEIRTALSALQRVVARGGDAKPASAGLLRAVERSQRGG